jgi:hypothetical protein
MEEKKKYETVNVRLMPSTRDKVMAVKNFDRKRFKSANKVILYLIDILEKFKQSKREVIGHTEGGYSKKELYEKARKEYFENLTDKEKSEFLQQEANRIKYEYQELEN